MADDTPYLPPPPDQKRDWVDIGWMGGKREPKKKEQGWRERLARLTARPFLKRIERGSR